MLRFTKQVDYGLMAMQYIAGHQGDGVIGVKRIAGEFRIPPERLAKILQRLARGGLVISHGGPRGGYRLPRPPSEVTIGQVIRILDGPIAIVSCMTNHDCPQMSRCSLRQPAWKIEAAITQLLGTMTLAELMDDDVPAPVATK
jgi:Rrf2 family protein